MRSTLLEDVEYPMLSSAPRPTLHRVRHCFCNAAALYWPLAAAVAMAVVGYLLPQGAVAYKVAMPCLIGTLFLVLGLCLDRSAWLGGVKALHVHTLMQGYSLVAQPVVYFYAAHQTGLDMTSGLLTTTLATGCVVMMAMPTTAATSLVFVQNANRMRLSLLSTCRSGRCWARSRRRCSARSCSRAATSQTRTLAK